MELPERKHRDKNYDRAPDVASEHDAADHRQYDEYAAERAQLEIGARTEEFIKLFHNDVLFHNSLSQPPQGLLY
ncbi:hypothetical protein SDC9_184615 [bioreactor metagenome]|uniref:Uncharacterized protein n=1 Tax=bioreactor metagenome TaxID=1076179 RepID=A0A645HG07_9ZZZZ